MAPVNPWTGVEPHQTARSALVQLRAAWCRKGSPREAAFLDVARIVFLEDETPYLVIARQHGCPASTVRGWVLSLRRDYGDLFREETARIARPDELADECLYLLRLAARQQDGSSFYATLAEVFRSCRE